MLIETDDSGTAYLPQVAADGAGNAIAVWYQSDGTTYNIWANQYVNGYGWLTAELIESNDTVSAYQPQLAMDGMGNALAIWPQYDGAFLNLSSNRFEAGSGWGTADLIVLNDYGAYPRPRLAMDDSGIAMAVWSQYSSMQFSIFSDRYAVGAGWGGIELVETVNLGNAIAPQLALDGGGNAVAVWMQENGTKSSIWANRYAVGAGWGIAEMITANESAYSTGYSSPQLAADALGNVIAVWTQYDGIHSDIWANRYVAGSGWGVAEKVGADDSVSASSPQVAIDAAGNAVATWSEYDGTQFNTSSSRYTINVGWGTPQLIGTIYSAIPTSPHVAVDVLGNAVTIWSQYDWTRWTIWTNRYVVDAGWGIAGMIETNNSENATSPQIAVDPTGNAYAVWEQYDGVRENIWAAHYIAPDPTPIPEFSSMPLVAITFLAAIPTIGRLRQRKSE